MPDRGDYFRDYCPACEKSPCRCASTDHGEEGKKPEDNSFANAVRGLFFLPPVSESSGEQEERHYSCTCTFGEFGRETGGCMEHGNGRRCG